MVMTLLCALHCRVVPYRRSPQTAATHADDWQAYLSTPAKDAVKAVSPLVLQTSTIGCRQSDYPTAIKPNQDPGYVAGFKPAAGQDRHKRSAAVINPCNSR